MLEFPYRPVYWQAFPYRIGLHQVTPLGVVLLFMLVNRWVEKHQRFYSTFTNGFFIFVTFFTFINVFLFFSGTFFTSMILIVTDVCIASSFRSASPLRFYRATLRVSAVLAVSVLPSHQGRFQGGQGRGRGPSEISAPPPFYPPPPKKSRHLPKFSTLHIN